MCRDFDSLAFRLALKPFQLFAQEVQFPGVSNVVVRQQAAEQHRRALGFAHVFEQKYAHLPRPARGLAGAPRNVVGIAQRKRHIFQPVARHDGAVRQPAPARIRLL